MVKQYRICCDHISCRNPAEFFLMETIKSCRTQAIAIKTPHARCGQHAGWLNQALNETGRNFRMVTREDVFAHIVRADMMGRSREIGVLDEKGNYFHWWGGVI